MRAEGAGPVRSEEEGRRRPISYGHSDCDGFLVALEAQQKGRESQGKGPFALSRASGATLSQEEAGLALSFVARVAVAKHTTRSVARRPQRGVVGWVA